MEVQEEAGLDTQALAELLQIQELSLHQKQEALVMQEDSLLEEDHLAVEAAEEQALQGQAGQPVRDRLLVAEQAEQELNIQ